MLVEVNWLVPLGIVDAIQSFLVDNPGHYYMGPSMQWLFILTRDLGMIQLNHDYSNMTQLEIGEFVVDSIRMFRDES